MRWHLINKLIGPTKKPLALFLLATAVLINSTNAQVESISIGVYGGLGQIKGNSPPVTTFNGSVFLDFDPNFFNPLTFRFSFVYGRKIEYYLPENREGRYYPFVKGFTLKAFLYQPLSDIFYLEYGLGPLLLNDRTFSDTDVWSLGLAFSAGINLDLRGNGTHGFGIGLGFEFGGTLSETFARYSSINFQGQYFIY